jgi:hypothetical protein
MLQVAVAFRYPQQGWDRRVRIFPSGKKSVMDTQDYRPDTIGRVPDGLAFAERRRLVFRARN